MLDAAAAGIASPSTEAAREHESTFRPSLLLAESAELSADGGPGGSETGGELSGGTLCRWYVSRGLLREWRRRRDAFLLCRRRFYENRKRLESSSCWAFWPRLFERFDVIRAVAGPGAEDVCGHMVKYL